MSSLQEYHEITLREFENFLDQIAEYRRVPTPNADENVYEIDLPKDTLSIRIFSSIEGRTTRGCGEDSIKAVVWHQEAQTPVGGRERTNRQPGWRDNLQPKIEDLMLNYRQFVTKFCPECDDALITQTIGPFREYLDCYSCEYSEEA